MTRFEFRRRLLGFPGPSPQWPKIVMGCSCHARPHGRLRLKGGAVLITFLIAPTLAGLTGTWTSNRLLFLFAHAHASSFSADFAGRTIRNESSGSLALASCHIQTRSGLCGFVSAECSPMLLAGEQAPLSSPRRRHNGHGRTCHWFGPVANGPKRSFCLEQTSCEQFDIASDQKPMASVIGGGGYC
jgi:hypothetical protein